MIPPLLNDFISLQKDTALVGAAGVFDALFAAQDYANYHFNYTPLRRGRRLFVVLTIPLARFTDSPAAPRDGAGEAGRPMSDVLLEVTDVRKAYGDKVVLADVSPDRAAARRGLPDRRRPAPASRRCCAA